MAAEIPIVREVRWSPKAEKQWDEILLFYCRRNGFSDYSLKLSEKAYRKLDDYAKRPELGERTKRKGVRRLIVENFVLFYQFGANYLEVVAVVDARRNVDLD